MTIIKDKEQFLHMLHPAKQIAKDTSKAGAELITLKSEQLLLSPSCQSLSFISQQIRGAPTLPVL